MKQVIAMGDDDYADLLGGAVGGIAKADVPQIVANLLADRETDLELWIRPERVGHGYTVEWTTLEYDTAGPEWRPGRDETRSELGNGAADQSGRQLLSRVTSFVNERMPSFEVDRERINLFAIDDRYLFKQYFDQDDVFAELRRYYNEDDYRFEVPQEDIANVQALLEDHFYAPRIVDDPEEFCVVHRKYAKHPDVLFKASVLQRSTGDHHVFMMKDQLSVEQAVNNGATRLVEADVEIRL